MIPQQADIVVIGGGPAGSLAATFLAQNGYEVVLFDKQHHPRYQVGESLIPDFWKYMDQAGMSEQIAAEGFIRKAGGTVVWLDEWQQVSFEDYGYNRPAFHVERDRFDHLLLQNAQAHGVPIHEGVSVLGVEFQTNEQHSAQVHKVQYRRVGEGGTGTIRCRYIIDASGQNTVLGRQLGLRVINKAFRFMSVWGYFTGSDYVAGDGTTYPTGQVQQIPPTTFVTSLPQAEHEGWAWHIMLKQMTSVGFVLPLNWMQTQQLHKGVNKRSWDETFLELCETTPILNGLLAAAQFVPNTVRLVRDYSYRTTKVAGPGYFLIGDAAGFIDPIFSVGVVLSMYGAYISAWALDRCLCHPARAPEFQTHFSNQLESRLALAHSLALPRYQGSYGQTDIQDALDFSSDNIRGLMKTVSKMTSRSEEFIHAANQHEHTQ